MEPTGPGELVARVEKALAALDAVPTPWRVSAHDAVKAVVDLYGAGLVRVLARVEAGGASLTPESLAEDALVAHLLEIHGLHPLGLEDPVEVLDGDQARVQLGARSAGGRQ
jgi:hypothetical protein